MKTFKVAQVRDLLNQVYNEKITFSRFVEILNEHAEGKRKFDIKPLEESKSHGLNGASQSDAIRAIPVVISRLKERLEINAGRLAEPLLKQGKQPKEDKDCHKAFLMLAHLAEIEDYLNGL